MEWDERQAHAIILAKTIEEQLPGLLTEAEKAQAMAEAVAAARFRGVEKPQVADVVATRAQWLVNTARAKSHPLVDELADFRSRLDRLRTAMPVIALVLGLLSDRIANAHRVDLLSPPLLTIVAWNLLVYGWLLLLAARGGSHGQMPWQQWIEAHPLTRRRHPARKAFLHEWQQLSGRLYNARLAATLHMCAAAWAAGFVVSLLMRGLVVRYQFGWESTFLDPQQVHGVVTGLFWPLTAFLNLKPFSLEEIAAAHNFAPAASGGRRWVLMYSGMLMGYIVVPRLLLAAWAMWKERRWRANMPIQLSLPYFENLEPLLNPDIRVGVVSPNAGVQEAVRTWLVKHAGAPDIPITSGAGDSIRFVTEPDGEPVGAVILLDDGGTAAAPSEWGEVRRRTVLAWPQVGESWVQESRLFDALIELLPRRTPALSRLKDEWEARNSRVFACAMRELALHLRRVHAQAQDEAADSRYAALIEDFERAQLLMHGQDAVAQRLSAPLTTQEGGVGRHTAVGAGVAAGAASGAVAGAKVDAVSFGATLGAGAAVGAMIGGIAGWVVRGRAQKGRVEEFVRRATEAGVLAYLAASHFGRVSRRDSTTQSWNASVASAISAHWAELRKAFELKVQPDQADPLEAVLQREVHGLLQRRYLAMHGQ